jgi:hypothetical protein
VVAGDVARLSSAHAPPAGRGGQAHALGQLGIGEAPIHLQLIQDGPVEAIKLIHEPQFTARFFQN